MEGLNKIYRTHDAHEEMKKKDAIRHPISGEEIDMGEYDKSLQDITTDPKESELFYNKFLFSKDPTLAKDIVEAIADGTVLTDDQREWMEKMRPQYNMRRLETSHVSEELTADVIKRLAGKNKNIQQIVGMMGAEKAAAILAPQFENLAVTDEKGFKKMMKEMRGISDIEESKHTESILRKVQQTLGAFGISESDYNRATLAGTDAEKEKNLKDLAHKNLYGYERAIDFMFNGSISRKLGKTLFSNFEEQQKIIADCDKHMGAIGKLLAGTINADMKQAMQRVMSEGGTIEQKKEKMTIASMADYKKAKNEAEPPHIDAEWQKVKDAAAKKGNIRDWTAQPKFVTQLEDLKESFAKKEFQKQQGHKAEGVFAILWAMLTGSRSKDDIKAMLK